MHTVNKSFIVLFKSVFTSACSADLQLYHPFYGINLCIWNLNVTTNQTNGVQNKISFAARCDFCNNATHSMPSYNSQMKIEFHKCSFNIKEIFFVFYVHKLQTCTNC